MGAVQVEVVVEVEEEGSHVARDQVVEVVGVG